MLEVLVEVVMEKDMAEEEEEEEVVVVVEEEALPQCSSMTR